MRRSGYKHFYKIAWLCFIFLFSVTILPGAYAEVKITDISLTDNQVDEDVILGTAAGEFIPLKQEGSETPPPQTYVFTLVDGTGAESNSAFSIDDSYLKIAVDLDSETAYTIRVRAQNQSNPDDFVEKNFTIIAIDTDPTASFTATSASDNEPLQVDFTDTSESYDSIVSWAWDFGNGTTSTAQNPQDIVFEQEGIFTVTLTVTEEDGDTSQATTTSTVGDTDPTASINASYTSGDEPLQVDFTDTSESYDGIVSWVWDFENGTPSTSTAQHPLGIIFEQDGIHTVTLTVTEEAGDTSQATTTITVGDTDPTASFNASYTSGDEPSQVDFT
ncbi:MAG: PKD domain-containing protein, partial [Desulfobacteraceae bacterium]|nr:PKD domain-containing protein [Desulfobacteraceae bacterium]